MMYYFWPGGWILGGIAMLIFWVALFLLMIAAVRGMSGGRRWHHHEWMMSGHSRALDIARERYAKGEITKEQYDDMKKTLAET